jgi:hypothetical protein
VQVEFLHTLALLDEPRPADGAAPAAEVPELRAARGLFRWEARRGPSERPHCPCDPRAKLLYGRPERRVQSGAGAQEAELQWLGAARLPQGGSSRLP